LAGVIYALAEPFLRPFRRLIPPIGGVDLSPIVLLLLLQLGQNALAMGKYMLLGLA
jgi:YggT family protein